MTTIRQQARAEAIADDFVVSTEEQQKDYFLVLAEYDEYTTPDEWAKHMKLPDTPETFQLWRDLHASYMTVWRRIGSQEFFERLGHAKTRLAMVSKPETVTKFKFTRRRR